MNDSVNSDTKSKTPQCPQEIHESHHDGGEARG